MSERVERVGVRSERVERVGARSEKGGVDKVNENDGWQRVSRRRGYQKMDVVSTKQGTRGGVNDTVSFFFTEFPKDFGAKEMWSVFDKFGRVQGVVIPNKRDKRGKRFGFIRFFDIRDPSFFATRLDNIIIGNQKLFVNLPRFQRGQWESKMKQPQQSNHNNHHIQRGNMGYRKPGTTFAQTVKSDETRRGGAEKPNVPGQFEFAHLHYNIDDSIIQKMNKAYVGQVSRSGTAYSVQEKLSMHGCFTVKATPLGANLVLFEAEDDEAITS